MPSSTYTAQQLLSAAGVNVRTLRHWIAAKVVPKPLGRGRGARYTEAHLLRVKVVRQLRAARLSLRQIGARIGTLSDEQLLALLPPEPRATTSDGVPVPPPPPSYPATTYEAIFLMEGMVLLVQPEKGSALRRIANEIYRYYGPPQRTP